ncbi:hypothetical protein FMEXI_4240 [Fusarium mexicanum]|uniref:Uncharacterized protein n=1 Tax=Fusarium mexicanum TaxID=751941 RepID=A0A8H5J650_9HYPO|nr:hypothetical protein FMEXI_4240 [Fusarium mexicanum]
MDYTASTINLQLAEYMRAFCFLSKLTTASKIVFSHCQQWVLSTDLLLRPGLRRPQLPSLPLRESLRKSANFIFLRIVMQQTIWKLDSDCKLAKHLKRTMDEIRRHNLAMLLPASPINTSQELDGDESCSTANSEVLGDSNMDEPVSCVQTAPERTSYESDTEDIHEMQDTVAHEVPEIEATANESQATTRKRTLDDDETPMPLAKRVRTWIGGVFTSRTAYDVSTGNVKAGQDLVA